ncbi:hypothetical protein GH733_005494 [Mirounga leonina]|nr:hypothetical protein GH733_005494 [Mirounga leonina]
MPVTGNQCHFPLKGTTLISLSFGGAIGLMFLMLGCALPIYNQYWPLFVLFFYILSPIPYCIARRLVDDTDAMSNACKELAIFLTTGIVVSAFGLPIVFARAHLIEWGACALVLTGNTVIFATILGFFLVFGSNDDFSWQQWLGRLAARAAQKKQNTIHEGEDTVVRITQQPERGEAPGLHGQHYISNDELGVGPGEGPIEQLHRPGSDKQAGKGMNQVISLHHQSPAEETEHLSWMESMPPGREGERLQQGPGPAVLEYEASEPLCCALVPFSREQGNPVGCFQGPDVPIRNVSLLTRALTKPRPKARSMEEGVIQDPAGVVGEFEEPGCGPHDMDALELPAVSQTCSCTHHLPQDHL